MNSRRTDMISARNRSHNRFIAHNARGESNMIKKWILVILIALFAGMSMGFGCGGWGGGGGGGGGGGVVEFTPENTGAPKCCTSGTRSVDRTDDGQAR